MDEAYDIFKRVEAGTPHVHGSWIFKKASKPDRYMILHATGKKKEVKGKALLRILCNLQQV